VKDRHTLWRIDTGTKVFVVMWLGLAVFVIQSNDFPDAWSAIMILLALIPIGYLAGPSARVIIRPGEVTIVNPFQRFNVPTARIRGWDRDSGWQQPRLHVDGLSEPIPVLAFQLNKPVMTARRYEQWATGRMAWIDRAVAEQTPSAEAAGAVRRRRWSTIVVLIAGALLFAAPLLIWRR
jgi:hypothetical protein